jgi:hypothetical protein
LVYLDWDDTCFPTNTLYNQYNVSFDDTDSLRTIKHIFRKNEQHLIIFLKQLMSVDSRIGLSFPEIYLYLYIISNATLSWVEQCIYIFMPELQSLIHQFQNQPISKCVIISARDEYSKKYPFDQYMWKYCTFYGIIMQYNNRDERYGKLHIISIGDADYEWLAIKRLKHEMPTIIFKNVHFINDPTLEELNDQFIELTNNLTTIINHTTNRNITFTRNNYNFSKKLYQNSL